MEAAPRQSAVIALTEASVDLFAEALGPSFEIDRDMLREALRRGSCANGLEVVA